MGKQLIFCVETNSKNKSDLIYIRELLDRYYCLDDIKISSVYMNGKTKYKSNSVVLDVNRWKRQYKQASPNGTTHVIYCFDSDDYDSSQTDLNFLKEAKKYCEDNKYEFVWFCKDIESVFLGRCINDDKKAEEAAKFKRKNKINEIDDKKISSAKYSNNKTNIFLILDKLLKRK